MHSTHYLNLLRFSHYSALERNLTVFGMENGGELDGECFAYDPKSEQHYARYGRARGCRYGNGNSWRFDAYRVKSKYDSYPNGKWYVMFQHFYLCKLLGVLLTQM